MISVPLQTHARLGKYDPAIGTFQSVALLNMTFAGGSPTSSGKRLPLAGRYQGSLKFALAPAPADPTTDEETSYTLPELEKLWDDEWEWKNLLHAATNQSPPGVWIRGNYQIFDCYVNKRMATGSGLPLLVSQAIRFIPPSIA